MCTEAQQPKSWGRDQSQDSEDRSPSMKGTKSSSQMHSGRDLLVSTATPCLL